MSNWIPREKLTAYQRWEVVAFDEQQRVAAGAALAAPEAVPLELPPDLPLPPPEPAAVVPTAAEIEDLYRQAQAAGHAAGYAQGFAAAQAEASAIGTLLGNLQEALAVLDQGVAEQLLTLAVEIANQVLRQSLRLQPELVLPVVREALTALHPHHGQPLLFANPEDAALVRKHLGEQLVHANWRIIDDRTLTVGGCRVELGASEVDATLETRWRRVVEAIGVSQEWLVKPPPSVAP